MKDTTIRTTLTVDKQGKILALCITLLNTIWVGDVKKIIRSLVAYYEIEL